MVRRPTLYKGTIGGHLDVVVLAIDGEPIEIARGRWRGTMGGDHAAAASYAVAVATPPARIARVQVRHCYSAH
ncbi:MAG: hypothetical protein KA105_00280 [Caulobacter sp.]|nr:hypothetical protein [Caulobacter sp.]